ncbi:hypothetical protein ABZU32_17805 [Sphaerisporangium sp. NPDC005288]|uniref:hypothetical protein n=1 Tax=Sphaerisporangium sp. NPDC005288 TaxID=3155114 RepID=UPI0033A1D318
MQLGSIVPVLGGILGTLLGVVIGGVLTRRAQKEHWLRDRQVDACLGIMRESNRVQFGFLSAWRDGTRTDWVAWNEALTVLTLVSRPDLVSVAHRIDQVFWETNRKISMREITSEKEWAVSRGSIEDARLAFINLARRQFADRPEPVARLAARPPLPEGGHQVGEGGEVASVGEGE